MHAPLSLTLIALAIISIPVVLGIMLLAYLWEKIHGGQPVKLIRGMDFEKMGMLAT
jgi:hypothetical protein